MLDKHTMRDAVDASIKRGHVIEIFPRKMRFSLHHTSATACKKDKSIGSINGAFTRLTTIQI